MLSSSLPQGGHLCLVLSSSPKALYPHRGELQNRMQIDLFHLFFFLLALFPICPLITFKMCFSLVVLIWFTFCYDSKVATNLSIAWRSLSYLHFLSCLTAGKLAEPKEKGLNCLCLHGFKRQTFSGGKMNSYLVDKLN